MGVTVQIPSALKKFTDNRDSFDLPGTTVGETLESLVRTYPVLKSHLYTPEGQLRNFVNVYLNDDDIRYLQQTATKVKDGDVVTIVPAVAGGAPANDLSKEEILRYSRHLIMPEVGMEGQRRLKNGSVLIIGTGGLGSPLALYLAAAGIGRIGLVDFDVVDFTNLQRQIIHGTSDVGRPKLISAKEGIQAINPFVKVDTYDTRITADNALELIKPYDIIIDGTDNFPTRYLVNDACVLLNKPNVYGSIFRFDGQASVFWAEKGPCYRCLYPEPPPPGLVPSCAEGGVLGILPGIIGVIQATEAVKLLIGKGEPLIGRLVLYNALTMKFREMKLRKDPACPICGTNPTIKGLIDYEEFCGIGYGDDVMLGKGDVVTVRDLKKELDQPKDILLLDVREPHEWEINKLPGATFIAGGDLETRMHELDRKADIVVYCRTGQRSAKAVKFLHEQGFPHVRNLAGGIVAWADQVDQGMATY